MASFDHDRYAATLAWAVEWLRRSATPGPPQKAALKALLDLAEQTSATLRFYDGVLTVDDTAVSEEQPVVGTLVGQLRAHGVLEISIARGAEAPELLALCKGLAQPAGQGRIKERLRDATSARVMVILEQLHEAPGRRRQVSFTQAFAKATLDEAVMQEWNKFISTRTGQAEPGRTLDIGMGEEPRRAAAEATEPAPVAPAASAAPSAPAASVAPAASAPAATAPAAPPLAPRSSPLAPQPSPPAPAPEPSPPRGLPQPPTLQASTPLGIALATVLQDPYGKEVLQRLTQFARRAEDAFAQDKIAEAVDAMVVLIDVEAKAPPEARNAYDVITRRVLTRAALAMVVPYVLEPRRAERATSVLRRGGEDSVNLLLGLIATASTLNERLAYAKVLKAIPKGTDKLLAMLTRGEWQVVRNIAEVVGEAGIEQGAAYLSRLFEHGDQRVQRTAIAALARLGTPATVDPLRRLLKEGAPEIKALVAGNIGGPQAKPLVPVLVAAIETEAKPELVREYHRALGRIGTPEAVQALARAAEPGGKLLGRKSAATRLAAVEGLKLAGAAGADALRTLAEDGDKTVREAARGALEVAQAGRLATR